MTPNPRFDKVMLIDDNPIDLYVAARLIKKTGLAQSVLEFTSAEKALEYLRQHTQDKRGWPQLMLVDIYMPGMSGFDFMAAYSQFPDDLRNLARAYIVSSSIDERDIEKAQNDRNVVAFQEKPVTSDFLEKIAIA